MTLSRIWVLHFLWLLPLAALLLAFAARQRERALARFADPDLLGRLGGPLHRGARIMKNLLLLSSLGLTLFALAGPRWGSHYQEVSRKGVDIVFVVDVSRSMMVEDVSPNRLEQARREILDFLKVVEGDQVALVAFAGAAFVQCPLTVDYGAVELFLNALEPDLIPLPGTDLGAAVETGLSTFDFDAETDKVMVLITDGEDNEGQGSAAAAKAAARGVRIFVYGLGDPAGGPVPSGGDGGGFQKDESGKMVLSKLDEEGLREIASLTGGTYFRSMAGDLDLDLLYFSGIKARTEAREIRSGKIKVYEERFPLFLLPAFLFLLLEGFVRERKPLPEGQDDPRQG
jgi:Ca-activated chloride channel family protein